MSTTPPPKQGDNGQADGHTSPPPDNNVDTISMATMSPAKPAPRRGVDRALARSNLSIVRPQASPRIGMLPPISEKQSLQAEENESDGTTQIAEEEPLLDTSTEAHKEAVNNGFPDEVNTSVPKQAEQQSVSNEGEFQRAIKGLDAMQIDEELYSSLDGTIVVYKGREKYSLLYVQVKKVVKGFEDDRILSDIIHEVRVLNKLKHDRIMKHFAWYQTPRHVWVVSEFCAGGQLREILIHHPLETECVKDIVQDVASALVYLHVDRGIVHGDVRPENIFLTESGVAKLAGFSMARLPSSSDSAISYKPPASRTFEHMLQFAEYFAPELLRTCAQGQDVTVEPTMFSDVWTFGVTVYECIIGSPPFTGTSFAHLFERIVEDEPYYFREGAPNEFSMAPFVKKLLCKDPNRRLVGEPLLTAAKAL